MHCVNSERIKGRLVRNLPLTVISRIERMMNVRKHVIRIGDINNKTNKIHFNVWIARPLPDNVNTMCPYYIHRTQQSTLFLEFVQVQTIQYLNNSFVKYV